MIVDKKIIPLSRANEKAEIIERCDVTELREPIEIHLMKRK